LTGGAAPGAAPACSREPEQLALFEGLGRVDVSGLRRERAAIAEARRSVATRRAYAADWSDFAAWCAMAGRPSLPASSDTVGLYLVHLGRRGLSVSTIGRRCAAISAVHLAGGDASPIDADVREVLCGLRRKLGVRPLHAKAAVGLAELRRMLEACPRDLVGVRDRALLLLGFAGGFRRSELAGLDLADVEVTKPGLVVRLARSKTDQEGAGREVGIHRGRRVLTDPVRALEAWIVERGRWPGPLFCPVVRLRRDRGVAVRHRRMAAATVALVVKSAAVRAGLDASVYAGHSLRAGCATVAAELGRDAQAIMGRTGHRSEAMVRRYVRHGSLFAVDPLAGAL